MAIFITVQQLSPKTLYRLNVDQIVSYAGNSPESGTRITLSTGGAIDVALTPEQIDNLLRGSAIPVFSVDGARVA
jgi:hypothetical protein